MPLPEQINQNQNLLSHTKIPLITQRAPLARGESLSSTASSDTSKTFSKNQQTVFESDIDNSATFVTMENASDDHPEPSEIVNCNENKFENQNENEIKHNNNTSFCYSQSISVPNFQNNRILDISLSNQKNNHISNNNENSFIANQYQKPFLINSDQQTAILFQQKIIPQQQQRPQQLIRSSKNRKFIVIPANSPTQERSISPSKSYGKIRASPSISSNKSTQSSITSNTKSLSSVSIPSSTNSITGMNNFKNLFKPNSTSLSASPDKPNINVIVNNSINNEINDNYNSINNYQHDIRQLQHYNDELRDSLNSYNNNNSTIHQNNDNPTILIDKNNIRLSSAPNNHHPVFIVGGDENFKNDLITSNNSNNILNTNINNNNNNNNNNNATVPNSNVLNQIENQQEQQQQEKQYNESIQQQYYYNINPKNSDAINHLNYKRLANMTTTIENSGIANTTNITATATNYNNNYCNVSDQENSHNSDLKAFNSSLIVDDTMNAIKGDSYNNNYQQNLGSASSMLLNRPNSPIYNSTANNFMQKSLTNGGAGNCYDSFAYNPANYYNFPIISNSVSQSALGFVNFRQKNANSSMRSVVSAHIPDNIADQLHYQQMSLQSPPKNVNNRILRTSSYIEEKNDKNPQSNTIAFLAPPIGSHFGGKIFSDANSVRSLASIGVGSTDGRKLYIRHVPNSPLELLKIVSPPPPILPDDDDDDSSIFGYPFDPQKSQLKPRRQHWANKMQFVLACIGYSVGLGNVWRFPYMCYKSGGGAFLVPYFIILIVCSTPMLYMELAVGQYTGRGPIAALGQICPLFKGAGLASVIVSFLMSTYYSVIIAYSIYYFFTSMKTELPWTGCNHRWSTPDCWMPQREGANITKSETSRTPSELFFEKKVLQISSGIEDPGTMRWELFACLICAWLLVYFATWKSIKSSAKVRYFTATFPFFLIVVLMGRALTLEGAENGLRYFFRPKWSDLGNANIWINAASQNFNSLGIAFGSMISFASYNKYNNNILHDTLAVSIVNAITSILVGIFAFATLGNLALEQSTDIEDVISDGPGFIFVVYPQVMAKMPYAQLWGVMFFFMLLCLGLNSQFAIVEVVVTSLRDGFPNWIKRKLLYHEVLVFIVCVVSFLFGLPNIIQGGMYFFQLMDHYAASISIMFLAFFQMIAIGWCYGAGRLSSNVKQMTGKAPAFYLKTCWVLCGPALLISLWIFSLINYKEPTYNNGKYIYPNWAYALGWTIASLSLVCIPAYAIINVLRASGDNLCDKFLNAMKPNIYVCRICGEHHCEHDFPEDALILPQNELTPVIQPKIVLRTPPPCNPFNKNSPLLTPTNQPNISVVEDESSGVPLRDEITEKS